MDRMDQSPQRSEWHNRSPRTKFEMAETMPLEDGSTGILTEFTARLESDGSWYYKSKYRSDTSACRISIRRRIP